MMLYITYIILLVLLLITFAYFHMCVLGCMHLGADVKVRVQLLGVRSLLLPCGLGGMSSGGLVPWQESLLDLSQDLEIHIFTLKNIN